jgi:hypothetical protein
LFANEIFADGRSHFALVAANEKGGARRLFAGEMGVASP